MHENLDLYESRIGEISALDNDCPGLAWWTSSLYYQLLGRLR